MTIPPDERARIDREIAADHRTRTAAWEAIAPPLDPDDEASRDAWIKARQAFFETHGVIPSPDAARARLAARKDQYRGERCFVIGNGPSLNDTALHLLENEFTFGVNRIYLMFERLSWRPTFYTTLDWRVAPDCLAEINALDGMEFFFPERFRGMLRDGDDVTWYWNDAPRHPSESGTADDASLGIRGAGSVSGAAIQLAHHMGFDPIHLIGCDVSYSVPGTVLQEGPDVFGTGVGLYLTSTQDDDANHFDKRYFGAGRRWHDPNVGRMVEGFERCAKRARQRGRTITNATEGGNLEAFPRESFRSLFPPTGRPPPRSSRAAFCVAATVDTDDGLMVDVGTGAGSHFAPFASRGWEIRAFDPDPVSRSGLSATVPVDWRVFLDPRAIDAVEGERPVFREDGVAGLSLVPATSAATTDGAVHATTPAGALENIEDRVVDVLAVEANGWEMEVLRAWPFAESRPTWCIVGVDDRESPRLGFDRSSVTRHLRDLGYRVCAFVDDGVIEADDAAPTAEGGSIVLVAGPGDSRFDAASLRVLDRAARLADCLVGSNDVSEAVETERERADALASELALVHASTSWRLGHRVVSSFARIRRAPGVLVRSPGGRARRALRSRR